jgi:serine/threonine protein kinase
MGTSDTGSLRRRRIDRYELQELIGEGGMGAVYRAIDSQLGRMVALKTVVSHRTGEGLTDELRQRFMHEALAASKVDHRNVVQVIDFGVAEDGTPYLVMEYLRGRDLGVLLKKAKTPLPIEYVADVMLGVCSALRACHQLGIVHRDLKPSNIFLADTDTGPEIKVLDFGVSKAPMAGDLTQEGQILGTPQYLSPEQVNGKARPESDQYALGVLLYVCLTKKLPFEEHQNLSLLRAIEVGRFQGPRAHRPEIPEALEAIILRAMHANPDERFESVHALGQALWTFASSRGQVEWKNYYFHTPPASQSAKDTLQGVPLAPAPEPSGVSLPAAGLHPPAGAEAPALLADPTAILQKSVDLGSEASGNPSPQLFISTKLARPTPAASETPAPSAPPDGQRRWRVWASLGVATGVIVAGVGVGFRHRQTSTVPVAPISSASNETVSKLTQVPSPLVSERTPAPTRRAPADHPVLSIPTAAQPTRQPTRPKQHRKHAADGEHQATHPRSSDSATKSAKSGKSSGLDANGIGIPSN